jgi:hypothetical protein
VVFTPVSTQISNVKATGLVYQVNKPIHLHLTLTGGRWPVAVGRWLVAGGRWPVAVGRWPLAVGRWPLAGGPILLLGEPIRQATVCDVIRPSLLLCLVFQRQ